jgi:hypothetical protein
VSLDRGDIGHSGPGSGDADSDHEVLPEFKCGILEMFVTEGEPGNQAVRPLFRRLKWLAAMDLVS